MAIVNTESHQYLSLGYIQPYGYMVDLYCLSNIMPAYTCTSNSGEKNYISKVGIDKLVEMRF